MKADVPSAATMLGWAREHVRSTLHGSSAYRHAAFGYICRFQNWYQRRHSGGCFLEAVDRTDFLRQWLSQPAVRDLSPHTVRIWLFILQRFTGWLLHQQRIEHDVLAYVSVHSVVDRGQEVPELWLRHNLQQDILRFAAGGDVVPWEQSTCLWSAHSWNRHLNRHRSHLESFPDFDEPLFLSWLAEVAREAPSLPRAVGCLRGLGRFLDCLEAWKGLRIHPLRELRERYCSGTEVLRELRRTSAATLSEIHQAVEPLRKTAFFQSALGRWMDAYLQHRTDRGYRIDGPRTSLHVLDRVLQRHGVACSAEITAAVVEDFLGENDPDPTTRNNRLGTYRGLVRYLESRGEPPPSVTDTWEVLAPSDFRPHIFTLREVGMLLDRVRDRSVSSRHPLHWLGVQTIFYLLYACGMRLGEPLMLRLQDVDLENRTLFIACTKFYKQRWVPFGSGAARRLEAYLRLRHKLHPDRSGPEEPFFINCRNRRFSKQSLQGVFRDVVRVLSIRSRGTRAPRLHDLRHSCALHRLYKWYADGADVQNKLPLLTTYLGHAKIQSTQVYLHITEDLLRQAGRGFQATFEQVVGPWMGTHEPPS